MKKKIFVFLLLFLTLAQAEGWCQAERVVACGDDKVVIIDCSSVQTDSARIIWRWDKSMAKGLLPERYQLLLRVIDECKPVNGGRQILLTASSDAVVLLDTLTRLPLFWAYVPMAHSAELLPGGRVAVALSKVGNGNSLQLYDIGRPEECIFRDTLYSGHGVVWMESQQRLYALGFDELRAYRLADWLTDEPRLEQTACWRLPSEGGHDLVKISDHELLVTSHANVHLFNTASQSFEVFAPLANREHVKSVSYNPLTGELIFTLAEESWWTHHIYGNRWPTPLTINHINLYKARALF